MTLVQCDFCRKTEPEKGAAGTDPIYKGIEVRIHQSFGSSALWSGDLCLSCAKWLQEDLRVYLKTLKGPTANVRK